MSEAIAPPPPTPTTAPPLSPVQRLVWAAGAPLLLVVVLGVHVLLRASSDLTPWKGGGFGMFSTVDSPASRQVRVELRGEMGTYRVRLPETFKDLQAESRAAPAEDRLRRLAARVADEMWVIPRLPNVESGNRSSHDKVLDDLAMQTMAQLIPVDAVKAIAKEDFDPKTQRWVKVSEVEVAVWTFDAVDDERPDSGGTLRPRLIRSVVVPAPIEPRR